jgi:hypothetical protein
MRKSSTRIITLAAVLVSSGCASFGNGYQVRTSRSASDGSTLVSMEGNSLGRAPSDPGYGLSLTAARYASEDGSCYYALTAGYEGPQWILIGPGESLVLVVDGKRTALRGDGSARFRGAVREGLVRERAQYEVDADLLKSLARAKAVRIRVSGERRSVESGLSARNLDNFKRFAADYVP